MNRSADSLALAADKEANVRRLIDALIRRDEVAVGALLADEVVYSFPGRSVVAGTYRGRDQVLELLRTFDGLFDAPPSLASHDVVASEAHVVELATHSATRAGTSFKWNVARVYHVDGDRIGEIWLMIGDLYTFDAFLDAE